MPLIVHILEEDIALWEPAARSSQAWHYRPRLGPGIDQEMSERIQVIAPAPLEELVDQDLVCFVNIEKGWLSRQVGEHPEVKFQLRRPNQPLRDPRRLRLKIAAIDASTRPPRVTLEDWKETQK